MRRLQVLTLIFSFFSFWAYAGGEGVNDRK